VDFSVTEISMSTWSGEPGTGGVSMLMSGSK